MDMSCRVSFDAVRLLRWKMTTNLCSSNKSSWRRIISYCFRGCFLHFLFLESCLCRETLDLGSLAMWGEGVGKDRVGGRSSVRSTARGVGVLIGRGGWVMMGNGGVGCSSRGCSTYREAGVHRAGLEFFKVF